MSPAGLFQLDVTKWAKVPSLTMLELNLDFLNLDFFPLLTYPHHTNCFQVSIFENLFLYVSISCFCVYDQCCNESLQPFNSDPESWRALRHDSWTCKGCQSHGLLSFYFQCIHTQILCTHPHLCYWISYYIYYFYFILSYFIIYLHFWCKGIYWNFYIPLCCCIKGRSIKVNLIGFMMQMQCHYSGVLLPCIDYRCFVTVC